MNKQSFTDTVLSFSQLVSPTPIVFPNPRQFTRTTINKGIIFVFSAWSGPSVHAWKGLTRALAKEPGINLKIYVLDADELPDKFADEQLAEIPQGKGETYWIWNGEILYRDHGYTHENQEVLQKRILEFS